MLNQVKGGEIEKVVRTAQLLVIKMWSDGLYLIHHALTHYRLE